MSGVPQLTSNAYAAPTVDVPTCPPARGRFRGRGWGDRRGGFRGHSQTDVDIESLWYDYNAMQGGRPKGGPYLRKITYIKSSVELFHNQEEIFGAEMSEIDELYIRSSMPMADQFNAVFHHGDEASDFGSEGDEAAGDENRQDKPSFYGDVKQAPRRADKDKQRAPEVKGVVNVLYENKEAILTGHAPGSVPPKSETKGRQDQEKKAADKQRRVQERSKQLDKAAATGRKNKKKDVDTIAAIIKEFVEDPEEVMLKIPAMSKDDQKKVNDIATAYNLKSTSKGNGKNPCTTLSRTPNTGMDVDYKRLIEALRGWGAHREAKIMEDGGLRKVRHRDGDIVGQHAAKIDESNVGYRLLQTLGWSAGDTIGDTGGLEAPLEAVFKLNKLGLGAVKKDVTDRPTSALKQKASS